MGAEGSAGPWWDWWVAVGPVAAATWLGTLLSAVGLLTTIVGFIIAVKAANAAKGQASAATIAVRRLKSAMGASTLAYSYSQLEMLTSFVADEHFNPAHILFGALKRAMLHHASEAGSSYNSVADLKRRMKTVSTHIGYAEQGSQKFNASTLRNALMSLQETIVDWENALMQSEDET
jgi:hypothetical protein